MRKIGVFESIFKKNTQRQEVNGYFETLTAYNPVFTTSNEGVYEMELTRASIHAFATHASKLLPEINGTAYKELKNILKFKPNQFMSTSQFLYRTATILSVNNTCYIVPIEDDYGYITGYYPIVPQYTEILDVGGVPFMRYTFATGVKATVEYSKVGVLTNFQYMNDFEGENNNALRPTMQLIHTQNEGIVEGVKNSAFIRFIARINNFTKPDDLKKERDQFKANNFGSDNNGGLVLFGNQYSDIKQVDSQPFVINADQQKLIQENVYNYFGVNQSILQNSYNEEEWAAFYEGKIEPFAIQLSLAMSNMTYTEKELARGNQIVFTANRLQYASNATKLQVSTQLFDRGILTTNQIMDIWNMAHVEDGDKRYIRKEYTETSKLDGGDINDANMQEQGIQNDVAIDGGTN